MVLIEEIQNFFEMAAGALKKDKAISDAFQARMRRKASPGDLRAMSRALTGRSKICNGARYDRDERGFESDGNFAGTGPRAQRGCNAKDAAREFQAELECSEPPGKFSLPEDRRPAAAQKQIKLIRSRLPSDAIRR